MTTESRDDGRVTLIKALFAQGASSVRLNSQAMAPLLWCLVMVLTASTAMIILGLAGWCLLVAVCPSFVVTVVYIVAYFYWMHKDPDRLGSEIHAEKR